MIIDGKACPVVISGDPFLEKKYEVLFKRKLEMMRRPFESLVTSPVPCVKAKLSRVNGLPRLIVKTSEPNLVFHGLLYSADSGLPVDSSCHFSVVDFRQATVEGSLYEMDVPFSAEIEAAEPDNVKHWLCAKYSVGERLYFFAMEIGDRWDPEDPLHEYEPVGEKYNQHAILTLPRVADKHTKPTEKFSIAPGESITDAGRVIRARFLPCKDFVAHLTWNLESGAGIWSALTVNKYSIKGARKGSLVIPSGIPEPEDSYGGVRAIFEPYGKNKILVCGSYYSAVGPTYPPTYSNMTGYKNHLMVNKIDLEDGTASLMLAHTVTSDVLFPLYIEQLYRHGKWLFIFFSRWRSQWAHDNSYAPTIAEPDEAHDVNIDGVMWLYDIEKEEIVQIDEEAKIHLLSISSERAGVLRWSARYLEKIEWDGYNLKERRHIIYKEGIITTKNNLPSFGYKRELKKLYTHSTEIPSAPGSLYSLYDTKTIFDDLVYHYEN